MKYIEFSESEEIFLLIDLSFEVNYVRYYK